MSIDSRRQGWEIWGVGLLVSLAVLVGLYFRGASPENVADAVKDIGAALIPILSAFVAARLVLRERDPAERFRHAGEDALATLARRHPGWLSGPKGSREDERGRRFLFFQKRGAAR
jgi:hypothetical protein